MKKKKSGEPALFPLVRKVFPVIESLIPSLAFRLFLFFFTRPLRHAATEKEREWEEKADKFTFNCKGIRIQGYSWGKGPAVIVFHGWAGRATQFYKFIPIFNRAGYRVVGMDGPAHGKSEGRRTDIVHFSDAVFQLKQHVGDVVAVIGHSFGAVVGLYTNVMGLGINTQINIASPAIGDEVVDGALKRLNGTSKTGDRFKEWAIRERGKSFDEVSGVYLVSKLPAGFSLMVVHDENDRELSLKHPHAIAKAFPSAHLMITRGLGHNRIMKDERVIKASLDFVRIHDRNAQSVG